MKAVSSMSTREAPNEKRRFFAERVLGKTPKPKTQSRPSAFLTVKSVITEQLDHRKGVGIDSAVPTQRITVLFLLVSKGEASVQFGNSSRELMTSNQANTVAQCYYSVSCAYAIPSTFASVASQRMYYGVPDA